MKLSKLEHDLLEAFKTKHPEGYTHSISMKIETNHIGIKNKVSIYAHAYTIPWVYPMPDNCRIYISVYEAKSLQEAVMKFLKQLYEVNNIIEVDENINVKKEVEKINQSNQ